MLLLLPPVPAATPADRGRNGRVTGRVVDAVSGAPVADAIVTVGDVARRADSRGLFVIDGTEAAAVAKVRARGYLRTAVRVESLRAQGAEVRLTVFRPKALYLTLYGIGNRKL